MAPRISSSGTLYPRQLGQKIYELKDHLGNIRATVDDRKLSTLINGQLSDFRPNLLSAVNYYPFGMQQPGRVYNAGNYRFGYNGKEMDNEVKGTGVQYDYGFRIYDARIAKFLSVDPLTKDYPWYTPYQFAGNTPIVAFDADGLEDVWIHSFQTKDGSLVTTVNYATNESQRYHQMAYTLGLPNEKTHSGGTIITMTPYGSNKTVILKNTSEVNPVFVEKLKSLTKAPDVQMGVMDKLDIRYYGKNGFEKLGNDLSTGSNYVKGVGVIATITAGPEVGVPIYMLGEYLDKASSITKTINAIDDKNLKGVLVEGGGLVANKVVGEVVKKAGKNVLDPAQEMVTNAVGDAGVDMTKDLINKTDEKK